MRMQAKAPMTMPWRFWVTATLVLVGTLFGGFLHGRMVTRSGADELLLIAGQQLQKPRPEQHGNWRLVGEASFSAEVIKMLQCSAHISRTYMHQQTGDTVQVFVIVGPPGPTSVHRPEICYGNQDFA